MDCLEKVDSLPTILSPAPPVESTASGDEKGDHLMVRIDWISKNCKIGFLFNFAIEKGDYPPTIVTLIFYLW